MKFKSVLLIFIVMFLTGCSILETTVDSTNKTTESTTFSTTSVTSTDRIEPIYDKNGEINILIWSGDGKEYNDLGNKIISAENLTNKNVAEIYAVAKTYNKIYPNVKINLESVEGGPEYWNNVLEDFKMRHGSYPDIFHAYDIVEHINAGLISDLSIFSHEATYQAFNPTIMSMINFYGFQAGLPYSALPNGIYINKTLAKDQNIDIPSPNWTIEEYTDFISTADMNNYYGASEINMSTIFTGSNDLAYKLNYNNSSNDYIKLDSDEVKSLLEYKSEWARFSLREKLESGDLSYDMMGQYLYSMYGLFADNKLLTHSEEPWFLDYAFNDRINGFRVKAEEWDYYPRPSTNYKDNTIGAIISPIVIRNYAMDDQFMNLSQEELDHLSLTYEFATFWTGDTRSYQSRANQFYKPGNTIQSTSLFTFPVVTGEAFDQQMDIWYSIESRETFADETKMPGFHQVIELWKTGQMWDVPRETYPWHNNNTIGNSTSNFYEWDFMNSRRFIPDLTTSTTNINTRLEAAFSQLKQSLIDHYGYTDEDLNRPLRYDVNNQ